MARAICSLDAVSRWAVTGTPIQNKLGDLGTILKFLKAYPYSEKRYFEADISRQWKYGNIDEAINRLKRLSGCLLLRRPKEILELPKRHDTRYLVKLNPAERQLYNDARMQAMHHISEAALQPGGSGGPDSYANVLQRIEAMRMICNIGLYYPVRHEFSRQSERHTEDWYTIAQRVFNLHRGTGQVQCQFCSQNLDTVENPVGEPTQPGGAIFSRCMRFICSKCARRCWSTGNTRAVCCEHDPPCPVAPVSTDPSLLEEPHLFSKSQLGQNLHVGLPSKVAALVGDLQSLPGDSKW